MAAIADIPPPNFVGERAESADLWCPACHRAVSDPLVCGDCSSVICRVCGTALESADELAFG